MAPPLESLVPTATTYFSALVRKHHIPPALLSLHGYFPLAKRMAGDKEPFMGPLGRPCTIYVERGGTFEGVALGQEQTIKAVGGIVTEEADEAAVVVVIERTEAIEQRIRDTCNYRMTDPVTQAELQGPPNWGGHLLRPKEPEPAITRDKAKEVALAIFGHLQAVEREAATGEPDAMQLDPAPAAGQAGATSQDDTQQEEPRGRRMIGLNDQEPGGEGEKSPNDIAWEEVKRLIEEDKQKRGFRTFSSDDMQILIGELYQLEAGMERADGWWEDFTARRAAVTPKAQRHSLDSWREFYRNRSVVINKCVNILLSANPGTDITLKALRDHSATTTSRYRNRSRSGGRNSNRSARGGDKQTSGTTPGAQASEGSAILPGSRPPVQRRKPGRPRKNPVSEQGGLPQTPPQAKKNGTVGQSQRSGSRTRSASGAQAASTATPSDQDAVEDLSYKDRDTLMMIMRFFTSERESRLRYRQYPITPELGASLDGFMRGQIGADPTRSPGSAGDTWTSRLQNDWDVIVAGAFALKGQAVLKEAGAQSRLSHPNEDFTAGDYDEMADFIANQIRARRVAKGHETSGMMQNPIWKAFAIVYQTDRRWEDWQTYYRENAEAINNTARKRLEEKSLAAKVDAEIKRLAASGRLNTPPASGDLKRPPEEQLDERHSKQLRL